MVDRVKELKLRIEEAELHLSDLKIQLKKAETDTQSSSPSHFLPRGNWPTPATNATTGKPWPMHADEYTRYGRQMIMPEIGLEGQLRLRKSSVLIIGLGGLGCPAAAYLAGSGVGTIGLVDGDTVDLSNLHRQILHTSDGVGRPKVDSAAASLRRLNPHPRYLTHPQHLTATTAVEMISSYDVVLDCTDHPTSRYLISDAAVLSRKPLVSASALRTEGQLMVLNNPPSSLNLELGGPCYRCVFPNPPPADSVIGCSEGGILGPVVGVMGVLMAFEAIKILASDSPSMQSLSKDEGVASSEPMPRMLLFSAYSEPQFRQVRLRGKRPLCIACSVEATITREALESGALDYAAFCGLNTSVEASDSAERIQAKELERRRTQPNSPYILLDVRDETQFGICNFPGSINIPLSVIEALSYNTGRIVDAAESEQHRKKLDVLRQQQPPNQPIYTICRFGNDSQIAVRKLRELGYDNDGKRRIGDIQGGLQAWAQDVDPQWPQY